jgi:DNA processing protein
VTPDIPGPPTPPGGAGPSGAAPDWFVATDDRTARAVWSRLTEPGDLEASTFVLRHGPAGALGRVLAQGDDPDLRARWRARLPGADPHRDLAVLRRFGGRLVVPGDSEWPEGLDLLGGRRPFCLWVRGPHDLAAACSRAVAIVGARASTEYGDTTARELAFGCAERGVAVVSGAAYGIDASAHAGALSAAGLTVAVLACGVDRPYPRGNGPLLDRIALDGLIVSEVPPRSSPTRNRFVHRNRLIAALASATVVVEAGWRSGASITAREAGGLGRSVGAVPGPVTSAASVGCHRLLRDGAVCITAVGDVVELVDPIGAGDPPRPPGARPRSTTTCRRRTCVCSTPCPWVARCPRRGSSTVPGSTEPRSPRASAGSNSSASPGEDRPGGGGRPPRR